MPWIKHLLALINALVADRARLTMENVALRQQIIVLQRSVTRAKVEDAMTAQVAFPTACDLLRVL
jgi:hypothetical protein